MPEDPTVSTGDIARLGSVGRAAVSNWRRRHDDFPRPVAGSATNPRFSMADVEGWLRRNGKAYRVSTVDRVWQRLQGGDDLLLAGRLAAVGALLVARRDPAQLDRLPAPAPDMPRLPDDPELIALVDDLAAERGPAVAFEELCALLRPRHTTPDDVADAMVRIALPRGGTLLDPCCGIGTLLLAGEPHVALGQDADPDASLIAAARLVLRGADGWVVTGDALRADGLAGTRADGVVCDPPAAIRGHDELAADDPRFVYGLPSRGEPELAWVQHGLARARAGATVVIRMPAAAATRRGGRRIRAGLLRAGAVHAVISPIEADGDLWVLRRPGGPRPPTEVLLARAASGPAVEVWQRFDADPRAGLPDSARTVPVTDLLDDDVDLAPAHHLPRRGAAHPGRAYVALRRSPDLPPTPELDVLAEPRDLPDAAVAELARSGLLTVRHAPARMALGEGNVAVLTGGDLARGTDPTGRTTARPGLLRARTGDVVAAPAGRARVADSRAVLGPGVTAYRMDPDRLDPEYLAGVLRAAAPAGGGASRHDLARTRVPLLDILEQRAYGRAFRELLDAADSARVAAERAEALQKLGADGLVGGWLRPDP